MAPVERFVKRKLSGFFRWKTAVSGSRTSTDATETNAAARGEMTVPLRMESMVQATSRAESGRPSWKRTPERR